MIKKIAIQPGLLDQLQNFFHISPEHWFEWGKTQTFYWNLAIGEKDPWQEKIPVSFIGLQATFEHPFERPVKALKASVRLRMIWGRFHLPDVSQAEKAELTH